MNNVVSIYKQCSDHAMASLAVDNGFDGLIESYFSVPDAKKFKTNLNIAIATAINTQGDVLQECLNQPLFRAKICNSIMKIIQLGAVVDYRYIYFSKFGGKNPDAGFNLQYQAEIKILEQNGYLNIETGYVLSGEKHCVEKSLDRTYIEHVPNMENRTENARSIINDVVFGYAIYTHNGVRTAHIIENDVLKASYKMSTDRSEKSGKDNLKWGFKKAIDISIVHALFRHLVLKDWDSEEYEYTASHSSTANSDKINTKTNVISDFARQVTGSVEENQNLSSDSVNHSDVNPQETQATLVM